MSKGMDIDKVLTALQDDNIKENSDSVLGLAKEVNTILSEFEKTCKTLENMHVLPAIVRGVGTKYGIDVDTPLAGGITPSTDYHKIVFDRLNAMSEADIASLLGGKAVESPKPVNTENGN